LDIPFIFILVSLCTSRLLFFVAVWQETQLLDSKTMLHAMRVNFENIGHTTQNKLFRLVKFLADLSTRLSLSMMMNWQEQWSHWNKTKEAQV